VVITRCGVWSERAGGPRAVPGLGQLTARKTLDALRLYQVSALLDLIQVQSLSLIANTSLNITNLTCNERPGPPFAFIGTSRRRGPCSMRRSTGGS